MSWKHLGETFDIHGGGIDLVFPHHENEIAQSRCAFHTPVMANTWMHNGFLQVEGEKMSKSLGNFVTIRELLMNRPGDALRLNMLRSNYRQPMDWTKDGVISALHELRSWSELISEGVGENVDLDTVQGEIDRHAIDALCDDLNTSLALTRLRELYEAAKLSDSGMAVFVSTASFFGFRHLNRPGFFSAAFVSDIELGSDQTTQIHHYRRAVANGFMTVADSLKGALEDEGLTVKIDRGGNVFVGNKSRAEEADPELVLKEKVENLISSRAAARKARDFKEADRIRDELAAMGIVLKDSKGGTTWEVAR
jgi:cysteinyl-tRNA synthetase